MPIVENIPAPIIAAIPNEVRSRSPKVRFRPDPPSASKGDMSEMGFLRKREDKENVRIWKCENVWEYNWD